MVPLETINSGHNVTVVNAQRLAILVLKSLFWMHKTTVTLWPELIVSNGTTTHLSFCACKTARLAPELLVWMGLRPHLSFYASKTTWLASDLLVSMGPSPHLCFLHTKQRLWSELQVSMGPRLRLLICECKKACLDPEWRLSVGPSLHLWFCAFKTSDFSTRIASLYGSQPSSVVLCIHKRWGLGPIETWNSGAKCAVFNAKKT